MHFLRSLGLGIADSSEAAIDDRGDVHLRVARKPPSDSVQSPRMRAVTSSTVAVGSVNRK
jgi:hypothetical protein